MFAPRLELKTWAQFDVDFRLNEAHQGYNKNYRAKRNIKAGGGLDFVVKLALIVKRLSCK